MRHRDAPQGPPAPRLHPWDGSAAPFRLEEAPWGFRIGSRAGERPLGRAAQALAMMVGAAAAAAGAALLAPVLLGPPDPAWALRLGLGAAVAGAGLLLLWFASRGAAAETEVDTARGEVRVVVRNLVGPPTLLAAQGFDAVAGLGIHRGFGWRGMAVLQLDLRAGPPLLVASGTESALAPLRRRLERDLLPGRMALRRGDPDGPSVDHPLDAFALHAA